MKALLSFLPLFARLRRPMLLSLLLSLVTLAAGIALLGVSGWFLTAAALTTAGAAFNLFAPSAGVRGLSFIRIVSRYGERLAGHDATLRLLSDLRRFLFERLIRLVPLGPRFGRGDLVSRLVADLDALDTFFLLALGPILTAVVAGAGMTVLLAFLLPAAALPYGLGFALAALGVPAALVLVSGRPGAEAVAASAALRGRALDALDGHQDLVAFEALARSRDGLDEAAARLASARRRLGRIGGLASAAVQALAALITLAVLLAGLGAISAGAIDGPLFVGLLLAVIASFEASAALVRSTTRLAASAAAATRLDAIAKLPPSIVEPEGTGPSPADSTIALDAVSFGYGGRANVLDSVSLAIAPGERVAILGPSGSGKSTIALLLARLLDPQAGRVIIGGVDLRQSDAQTRRENIVLMTQDAPVFTDSVRNNLRMGRPDADDDALWNVLERVGLAETIRALPGGLDAILGEAGRSLSAGQARRICLARILLSDAHILVLDEPTSGLDGPTETAFFTDLPRIAAGRSIVLITHADLPDGTVDRALRLKGGRLAA